MSQVSFVKPGVEVVPTPTPVEGVTLDTHALVPVNAQPVSRPLLLGDDADVDVSEINIPRINIVQKVGELSNNFPPGEIVLNQSISILDPKKDAPLEITIVGFRPSQFAEKVAGGKLGLLCNTKAEVAEANGTLDYKSWKNSIANGKPLRYFQTLATALCIVRKPDNFVDDETAPNFPYSFEGKFYALVAWAMKGTAFTNGAKVFKTARQLGHLRAGYTTASWTLTTELVSKDDQFYYIPVVEPVSKNSEGFQNFITDILGG